MKKEAWIVSGIIVIVIFAGFFLFSAKNCDNEVCFEQAARSCDKAEITLEDETGSETYYKIKGREDGHCLLYIKINKLTDVSEENVRLFRDADMTCAIPEEEFARMTVDEMIDNLDYCHGILKEAIYEVTLKNLYGLVTRDLGNVLKEINNVI